MLQEYLHRMNVTDQINQTNHGLHQDGNLELNLKLISSFAPFYSIENCNPDKKYKQGLIHILGYKHFTWDYSLKKTQKKHETFQ